MIYSIVDIETNGLLENVTKIHCVCGIRVTPQGIQKITLTGKEEIQHFFETEEVIVGHNIIRYDIPVIRKLYPGIKIIARLIDTLPLSWYLYPMMKKHGLEIWGEIFGILKPKIADWQNLSVEEYIWRCSEDVRINEKLFNNQLEYLFLLYSNSKSVKRFINYIMFKMDCAQEQEEVKWKLNVPYCQESLEFLKKEEIRRLEVLSAVMPRVTNYRIASKPKVMYKKDGTLSAHGIKWMMLLESRGLPEYHMMAIKVPIGDEPGNPGSHQQLKAWLFSLGWIPETFKYDKEEDGSMRAIPQISTPEGEICDSIKKLYEVNPDLINIEGLFVIRHRKNILEGFLERKDNNDFLKAEIKGFTNTLRFQHTTIVNLPATPKPYWEMMRGCLIAPSDDHLLCGSDMSSLEDSTKRHYIYYYDPEYVKEMMRPDFDAHLDIAMLGNMVTTVESDIYKAIEIKKANKEPLTEEEKTIHARIKPIRGKAKKVNFAGVYGAGPPKLALTGGFSLAEAKVLHRIYWQRNWSVKKISDTCIVKSVNEQLWLFNPVSQFWYSLRMEKDKFSTLNQSTGVYCFDTQVRNVRKRGVKMCGQFHDEFIFPLLKGQEEYYTKILDDAIIDTNNELQLNIKLGISKEFGSNYAEIH